MNNKLKIFLGFTFIFCSIGCKPRERSHIHTSDSATTGLTNSELKLVQLLEEFSALMEGQLFENAPYMGRNSEKKLALIRQLAKQPDVIKKSSVSALSVTRVVNMVEYIHRFSLVDENTLAYTKDRESLEPLSNLEYLKLVQRSDFIPNFLKVKNQLQDSVGVKLRAAFGKMNADKLNKIFRSNKIDALGIPYVRGDTDAGLSYSESRLLVITPIKKPQYYLLASGIFNKRILNLSVVRMTPKGLGTEPFYYDLDYKENRVVFPNRVKIQTPCLFCHKSGGPRAIHLSKGMRIDGFDYTPLDKLNEYISDLGVTLHPKHDMVSKILLPDFPTFGSESWISEDVIEQAVKKLNYSMNGPVRDLTARVKSLSNCDTCHDGVERGKLLPPLPSIEHLIVNGTMPPGVLTTESERKLLWQAMVIAYQSQVYRYLLGR